MRIFAVLLILMAAVSQGALAETITHRHHHRVSLPWCGGGSVTRPCECHASELCPVGRYCDPVGGVCY
jgi:hypothetical protein